MINHVGLPWDDACLRPQDVQHQPARVRRGGIRVACFDIIRTEQKWLRKINDSSRIQLDFYPVRSGTLASRSQIPDRCFEPGRYDAFIIGDVPASAFRPDCERFMVSVRPWGNSFWISCVRSSTKLKRPWPARLFR